jgi:nitrogen fixation NifU-like protein
LGAAEETSCVIRLPVQQGVLAEKINRERQKGMSEDLDKTIEEIQASIIEKARKIYSEKVIERWLHPTYMGEIENPQGYGNITGPCGDTIHIFLRIENDKIANARFLTNGCATSIAAGCMACELAVGKTFQEAFKITKEIILEQLDGLPEESAHCALLASNTLKAALTDYLSCRNEPWKRLYKKPKV